MATLEQRRDTQSLQVTVGLRELDGYMRRNRDYLLHILGNIVRDKDMREDIVQDSALRALDAIHRGLYDPNRNFATWFWTLLVRVAKNKMRDTFHERQFESLSALLRDDEEKYLATEDKSLARIIEQIDHVQEHAPVWDAMAQLPNRDQRLLRAVYGQEVSINDMANEYACTPDNLRQRLLRAKRSVINSLEAC